MEARKITIVEISKIINLDYIGNGSIVINGLNLVNRISSFDSVLSYATTKKLKDCIIDNDQIKAVIVTKELYDEVSLLKQDIVYFISDHPEIDFYHLHIELFKGKLFYVTPNFTRIIGSDCFIHKTAIIEEGVIIGKNVTIGAYSIVKSGTIIGDNSNIGHHTIIGSEGFQDIKINNVNILIPHVGGCSIGNNVTILDNSCVCNSLFENTTKIGDNTKIDNLVHIAHNCIIGENCTITAGTILCGSTIIENNVWIAPNSSVLNKVVLRENSMVGLGAVVLKDVMQGDIVVGNPAKSIRK